MTDHVYVREYEQDKLVFRVLKTSVSQMAFDDEAFGTEEEAIGDSQPHPMTHRYYTDRGLAVRDRLDKEFQTNGKAKAIVDISVVRDMFPTMKIVNGKGADKGMLVCETTKVNTVSTNRLYRVAVEHASTFVAGNIPNISIRAHRVSEPMDNLKLLGTIKKIAQVQKIDEDHHTIVALKRFYTHQSHSYWLREEVRNQAQNDVPKKLVASWVKTINQALTNPNKILRQLEQQKSR